MSLRQKAINSVVYPELPYKVYDIDDDDDVDKNHVITTSQQQETCLLTKFCLVIKYLPHKISPR